VEQELLTLPEHPGFQWGSCYLIVVCPFVLFLLAIVLSVLLQYTDSDFPFGIFNLFFSHFGYLAPNNDFSIFDLVKGTP
jgi:hypothetical protein